MKKTFLIITTILTFLSTSTFAQTDFKEQKVGHVFYVSLPSYMTQTSGFNDAAVIQFVNEIDSASSAGGYIIEETKLKLVLELLGIPSINEYSDDFMQDFLIDENERKISEPLSKSIGATNFIEWDASIYNADLERGVYYFVGFAETNRVCILQALWFLLLGVQGQF